MAELKTKKNARSVDAFFAWSQGRSSGRRTAATLVTLMKRATGKKPEMWGAEHRGLRELPLQGRERPRGRLVRRQASHPASRT